MKNLSAPMDSTQRSGSVTDGGTFSEISGVRLRVQDAGALARLGKSQELKRRFGFLSLFGFSCTILITWETTLALFEVSFLNGGPAGLAWGFPISWICSMSVYMVLAEMASIAPIAGGQYFWVAILAPRGWGQFLSYMTGWLTTLAWIATLGAGMTFVGNMLEGIIILNYSDYTPQPYQGTLFSWAIIFVAILVNTLAIGLLPFLEGVILLIHLLGFVGVIVPLLYLSDHVPASQVFFKALNEGGWSTQGLSYMVGYIGNVATFVGADAAVHMSEEIENAGMNVPRAMFFTLLLNGAMGYAMVLALLFCMTDIDAAINSPTGFPFITIFEEGTGTAGATIMTSIVVVLGWCAVIGFLATASRLLWSFARDKALPFSRHIRKVNKLTSVPIWALVLTTVIPCLLVLIYLGSSTIYHDVISLSVSGLYISYFIPCAFLLWRRLTNRILPYDKTVYSSGSSYLRERRNPSTGDFAMEVEQSLRTDSDTVVEIPLMWGPWKVPGLLGIINNGFACVYCLFVLFFDFWPAEFPAKADNMNYAVLVTGAVVIFSLGYYFLYGKNSYKGPLVEIKNTPYS